MSVPRLLFLAAAAAVTIAPARGQETVDDIIVAPGLEKRTYVGPLRDAYDRIDPIKDGWATEALSADVSAQLAKIAKLLEDVPALEKDALVNLVAGGFESWGLRGRDLETIYNDAGITVRRGSGPKGGAGAPWTGPGGFAKTLQAWFTEAGFAGEGAHPHAKLKLYRIEPPVDGQAYSRVLVTVKSHHGSSHRQVNAEWTCMWETPADALPRLLGIEIVSYEEVEVATADATPLLADATASVLGKSPAYRDQFLRPTDHWRLRLPPDFGLDVVANHGIAIGDVNGDGLEDIYVCQQGGLPNRLFLQQADGTLTDFSGYLSSAHIADESATLEHRVKSYLDSNCAHCHQPTANSGQANFDARLSTPLGLMGMVDIDPRTGDLGLVDPKIVKPGDPANSTLWHRDGSVDPTIMMPPLAKALEHEEYMAVLTRWSERIGFPNFDAWATNAGIIGGIDDDEDGDSLTNGYEFLIGLDGTVPDSHPGYTVAVGAGGQAELSIPLTGDALTDGLAPVVMDSVDLQAWFEAGTPGSILVPGTDTSGPGIDGILTWQFLPGPRGFAKVDAIAP